MPIVEPAELLGHITTEDGRKIPHYKVKTEPTITHLDTGAEYNSEAEAQADDDRADASLADHRVLAAGEPSLVQAAAGDAHGCL